MTTKISSKAPWLAALMAGAMLCACTNEAPVIPDNAIGGVEANNIVRLRLDGLTGKGTRADGDQTMEALDRERTINELYAVAFADCTNDEGVVTGPQTLGDGTTLEHGKLYDVFEVILPGETEGADGGDGYLPETTDTDLPHFRLDNTGKFRFFFVANPGDKIRAALNDKTILVPGQSTKDDLMALETDTHKGSEATRTGLCDVSLSDFLMFSYDSDGYVVENRTGDEQTINIKMQRAAARFDIVNMAEGYTIKDVFFASLPSDTYLGLHDESLASPDELMYFSLMDPTGQGSAAAEGWSGLTGSTTDPGYFSSRVYSYEYHTTDGKYPGSDLYQEGGANDPSITVVYSPVDNTDDERFVTINFREPMKYTENKDANASVHYEGYDNKGNYLEGDMTLSDGTKKGDYMIVPYPDDSDSPKGILYSDQYIPIQRNHLYRVRLTKINNVNETLVLPLLEVVDWNEAEILRPNPDDLKFDTPEDPEEEVHPLQEIRNRFLSLSSGPYVHAFTGPTEIEIGEYTKMQYDAISPYFGMNEGGTVTEIPYFTIKDDPSKKARFLSEAEFDFLYALGSEGLTEDLKAFGYDYSSLEIKKNFFTKQETGSDEQVYMIRFGGTPLQSLWLYQIVITEQGDRIKVRAVPFEGELKIEDSSLSDLEDFFSNPEYMVIDFTLPENDTNNKVLFPLIDSVGRPGFFSKSFTGLTTSDTSIVVPLMVIVDE